jgi:hypothetical protein
MSTAVEPESFSAYLAAQASAGALKDYIPTVLTVRLRWPKPVTTVTLVVPGGYYPHTVTADWEAMLEARGLPLTLRGLTTFVGGDYDQALQYARMH